MNWRDTTHLDSEGDYCTGCRNVSHWSTTTVLFSTMFTQTIKLNLLLKWLQGSNLSQFNVTSVQTIWIIQTPWHVPLVFIFTRFYFMWSLKRKLFSSTHVLWRDVLMCSVHTILTKWKFKFNFQCFGCFKVQKVNKPSNFFSFILF